MQTNSEYAAQYLTYKSWDKNSEHNAKVQIYVPPTFSFWPEFVDWRQKGAISDVKDQVSDNWGRIYTAYSTEPEKHVLYMYIAGENLVSNLLNNLCRETVELATHLHHLVP